MKVLSFALIICSFIAGIEAQSNYNDLIARINRRCIIDQDQTCTDALAACSVNFDQAQAALDASRAAAFQTCTTNAEFSADFTAYSATLTQNLPPGERRPPGGGGGGGRRRNRPGRRPPPRGKRSSHHSHEQFGPSSRVASWQGFYDYLLLRNSAAAESFRCCLASADPLFRNDQPRRGDYRRFVEQYITDSTIVIRHRDGFVTCEETFNSCSQDLELRNCALVECVTATIAATG